ncbi:hypothetical protein [Nonomuraea soli]|uniref:Uncharacterized protein n=1 Tax=Nonomuraea soli TaxID=1032476 RepID=A0A7W0CNL0_9ACTN|nr:hypothetical protein [Nonomuraea soli]MBA2894451.1 hypothetical protein [Nonomuraea soli]
MCSECRAAARRGPGPGAEIHRATAELVVLAAAVRPDWAEADVRAALAHAASVGMTWEQALVGMGRLMVDGHAHPRELVPDARDPLHPARPAAADVAHRGAQLARHLLPGPDREPS